MWIWRAVLGFKYVFHITRTPMVHSRDFHFHFDLEAAAMGRERCLWVELANPFGRPDAAFFCWRPHDGRLWLKLMPEALRTAISEKEARTQKYDVAMHPMVFTTETTSGVRSRTLDNLRKELGYTTVGLTEVDHHFEDAPMRDEAAGQAQACSNTEETTEARSRMQQIALRTSYSGPLRRRRQTNHREAFQHHCLLLDNDNYDDHLKHKMWNHWPLNGTGFPQTAAQTCFVAAAAAS